jgi:hypothetical protein
MSNELCEQRKTTLKENIQLYMQLIDQPTHVCEKCGRAANRKKLLCHPVPIPHRESSRTA